MKSFTVRIAAFAAVLPLVASGVWTGYRVAQTDPVLSVIAPSEQPLSVRSPVGLWAMALAVGWFAIVYWKRRLAWWEVALVVVGGAVALARVGNAWVFALAIALPLARQLALIRPQLLVAAAVATAGLAASAYIVVTMRPPALPSAAEAAAISTAQGGNVLADWRWAPGLQRKVESNSQVLASAGLASEPNDFWVDYVRIAQGHERWAEALDRLGVSEVVLDTSQDAPAATLIRTSPQWHVVYDADGALVAARAAQ